MIHEWHILQDTSTIFTYYLFGECLCCGRSYGLKQALFEDHGKRACFLQWGCFSKRIASRCGIAKRGKNCNTKICPLQIARMQQIKANHLHFIYRKIIEILSNSIADSIAIHIEPEFEITIKLYQLLICLNQNQHILARFENSKLQYENSVKKHKAHILYVWQYSPEQLANEMYVLTPKLNPIS